MTYPAAIFIMILVGFMPGVMLGYVLCRYSIRAALRSYREQEKSLPVSRIVAVDQIARKIGIDL